MLFSKLVSCALADVLGRLDQCLNQMLKLISGRQMWISKCGIVGNFLLTFLFDIAPEWICEL